MAGKKTNTQRIEDLEKEVLLIHQMVGGNGLKEDIDEIKTTLNKLDKTINNFIITMTGEVERMKAQIKTQWYVITAILVSIVGLAIKSAF